MKFTKKLFSLLLAIAMLFSITAGIDLSAYAATSGDYEYDILDDGTVEITDYTGNETNLTIPNKIDGKEVTSIGFAAFTECKSLISIVIPNSITSIDSYAFSECTSLINVTIPNSVTSISDHAFALCKSLKTITIPNSITNFGFCLFDGCTNLSDITIPSSVTSIDDYAFSGCTSLTSITVDKNNKVYDSRNNCNAIIETENNTLICGCKTTVIPNNVTSIGDNAFVGMSLTSITIPNSVTSIGEYAFDGCSSLADITISNRVTSIGDGAFCACKSLTNITIPNSVASIGSSAFFGCSNLKNITIPNSVTSIGSGAFQYCSSLTNIIIPSSVNSLGNNVFFDCKNLENITVDSNNKNYLSSNGVLYNKNKTEILAYPSASSSSSCTIPSSITNIDSYIFYNCKNLSSITIPSNVTSICSNSFVNCFNLTNITVDKDSKVYDNRDNCNALIETKTNTLILGCSNTVIPDSVTAISDYAFSGNKKISKIAIPSSVISIEEHAFSGCDNLINITVDKNNKAFDSRDNCNAIIETKTNTLFIGCGNTAIPNNVTNIGYDAFSECSSLTSITIPDSVHTINDGAFEWCDNLTTIVFPKNVSYVGSMALFACKNLNNIVFLNKNCEIYSAGFGGQFSDEDWATRAGAVNATVYGYANSTSESFANEYDKKFIAIDDYDCSKDNHCYIKVSNCTQCVICGEIKECSHTWDNGKVTKKATCKATGIKTITCTKCGETKTETIAKLAHTYKTTTTKATTSKNGSKVTKCSVCGAKKSSTTIYSPKTITLSKASYIYNGKAQKPSVTVKNSKGNKISASNYTVKYTNNKNVGKATVTITFKGNYSGTVKKTFTIKPKSTTLSSVTAKSKGFTAKWKKQATQTTGYEIQYSTSSKFSSAKTVTVSKNKTTSKTVSKLKAKKKYYVRVRTYKTVKVNGKSTKIYSAWSKVKSVKTK